jgi:arsenate reductase
MEHFGVSLRGQSSKSWDEFKDRGIDVVITLCDSAASIPCPIWSGAPLSAHWSHPDPAALEAGDDERLAAAIAVAERLRAQIEQLIALDFAATPRGALHERLRNIGGQR